jgi:hypothetical protein
VLQSRPGSACGEELGSRAVSGGDWESIPVPAARCPQQRCLRMPWRVHSDAAFAPAPPPAVGRLTGRAPPKQQQQQQCLRDDVSTSGAFQVSTGTGLTFGKPRGRKRRQGAQGSAGLAMAPNRVPKQVPAAPELPASPLDTLTDERRGGSVCPGGSHPRGPGLQGVDRSPHTVVPTPLGAGFSQTGKRLAVQQVDANVVHLRPPPLLLASRGGGPYEPRA